MKAGSVFSHRSAILRKRLRRLKKVSISRLSAQSCASRGQGRAREGFEGNCASALSPSRIRLRKGSAS